MHIPGPDEITRGSAAYHDHEAREAMYKVATFLVDHFWGEPADMADGLGVLLLTWNQAFYRYGSFDFELLESCIAKHIVTLGQFRSREISSFSIADHQPVTDLFTDFLEALRSRREASLGAHSPVAVAKALHLIAPGFFPLWDKEIATAYGFNYSSRPAEKYVRFMGSMKEIANRLHSTGIDTTGGKTLLKLIDEYNYSHFTKAWI